MTLNFIDFLYLNVILSYMMEGLDPPSIRQMMVTSREMIEKFNIGSSHVSPPTSRAYALRSMRQWQSLGILNQKREVTDKGNLLMLCLRVGDYQDWQNWPVEVEVKGDVIDWKNAKRLIAKQTV